VFSDRYGWPLEFEGHAPHGKPEITAGLERVTARHGGVTADTPGSPAPTWALLYTHCASAPALVNLTSGYAMRYPFPEILHVTLFEVEVVLMHQIARVHAHKYTAITAVGLARDTASMLRVNCSPC